MKNEHEKLMHGKINKELDDEAIHTFDDLDFAKPLSCFYWKSQFIYNFEKNRFETEGKAVPVINIRNKSFLQ